MRSWVAIGSFALACPVAVAILACGTVLTVEQYNETPDTRDDRIGSEERVDDGPTVDAEADAARPNPIINGDFELGCANWTAENASLEEATLSKSGLKACLVCVTIPYTSVALVGQTSNFAVPPGVRYTGDIFLRSASDAAPPTAVSGHLAVIDGVGTVISRGNESTGPSVDTAWKQLRTVIDVDRDGGTSIHLVVGATLPANGCFLVDNASIQRQ